MGIDIGGTKLAAGIVSAAGELLCADRVPTPHTRDAEHLFATLCGLIDRVATASGESAWRAIGVGCGGPMRYPQGAVSPLNIPAWREFPLRDRLAVRYRCPVVDNDAKAFALGEHRFGAGRGVTNLLGLVVSTGVGGGLILDGRLIHGGTGNAGHFGHLVVRANGPRCGCGNRGCIEAIASGPSVVRRYRARARSRVGGRMSPAGTRPSTELPQTGEAVAALAQAGDPLAHELLRGAARAVGHGIALVANLCDIDRAVVGGGLSHTGEVFFEAIRDAVREWTGFPFARRVDVVAAGLGPNSGVIGSAALVMPSDGP